MGIAIPDAELPTQSPGTHSHSAGSCDRQAMIRMGMLGHSRNPFFVTLYCPPLPEGLHWNYLQSKSWLYFMPSVNSNGKPICANKIVQFIHPFAKKKKNQSHFNMLSGNNWVNDSVMRVLPSVPQRVFSLAHISAFLLWRALRDLPTHYLLRVL